MTRIRKTFLWLGGIALGMILLLSWIWITIEPRLDGSSLPSQVLASPSLAYSDAVGEGRLLVRAFVAEENLPSLSLAVAVKGDIVWAEGFGWADYENLTPVTPATRFRIGSVSKVITAAAAGLLHERGHLDLDVPVQRYVPTFPEKEWPITTRQLMGHVAGIRHFRNSAEALSRASCADDRERLAIFADDSLRFQPGTAYGYSTYGYVLVGAVIAAVAEEPFLDFLHREIFTPLDMRSTVADEVGRTIPELARFYFPRMFKIPRLGLKDAPAVDLSCIRAGGGFLSNPSDLVRLGSAMMIGGDFMRQETITLLQTPLQLESGVSSDVGLGWAVRRPSIGEIPTLVVGASGNVAGGTALLLTVPDHSIVVALATNVSFADFYSLSLQLSEVFIRNAGSVHKSINK